MKRPTLHVALGVSFFLGAFPEVQFIK
jgi:hypothetical protein